jgi:superfamily II DNA/RNA helicase
LDAVEVTVLDEADQMADMGFLPEVTELLAKTPADAQRLLFSATLDGDVARIAAAYTDSPLRHEYDPQLPGTHVEHRFVGVSHESKIGALVDELRADRGLALVFVRTKRGADRLVKRLGSKGVEAVAMHGNKSQGQREKALARFDAGKVDALIATDVASRGIDVDGISHVINFDPPGDSDAYMHRVGRTARAGRSGVGVTFVKHEEAGDVGTIARQLDLRDEFAQAGFASAAPNGHGGNRPRHGNGGQRRNRGNGRRRNRSSRQRTATR